MNGLEGDPVIYNEGPTLVGEPTTVDDLRALVSRLGLSQRETAKALGVNEREFRRMCSGARPIPPLVMLAMRQLVSDKEKST